ncbi:MAG: ATP-binding cassette domain-containing protein [Verrucomicrobiota bacterium]|nr:ATP-binding cassette domain-containing protein [Limisphaera sp.]MDW8381534.1 ATP-binding cassette domain-containing protein [Verrucomicrobiota bacterium]
MSTIAQASPGGVALQVRDLQKRYGAEKVLQGVSFAVSPGEILVLMGPSGSGKTVLLRHLIGLEEPDAGEIRINGQVVRGAQVLEHYRVAMVFQSAALLNSLTVAENVGLYLIEHRLRSAEEIRRIVSDKLSLVGLAGAEDKFPAQLSGGMRKRVAIARALVMEPQLILYDEPTSELDPLSAEVIAEEILALRDRIGVTSIVVTHDRTLAFRLGDRIGFLSAGRLVAVDVPQRLRQHPDPMLQQFLQALRGPVPQEVES